MLVKWGPRDSSVTRKVSSTINPEMVYLFLELFLNALVLPVTMLQPHLPQHISSALNNPNGKVPLLLIPWPLSQHTVHSFNTYSLNTNYAQVLLTEMNER